MTINEGIINPFFQLQLVTKEIIPKANPSTQSKDKKTETFSLK